MQRVHVWVAVATDRAVVGRSLVTCLLVGAVLTVINQGDVIARGDVDSTVVWKMALTFLVPFVVATVSSTMAIRSHAGHDPHGPAITAPRPADPSASSDAPNGTSDMRGPAGP